MHENTILLQSAIIHHILKSIAAILLYKWKTIIDKAQNKEMTRFDNWCKLYSLALKKTMFVLLPFLAHHHQQNRLMAKCQRSKY